MQCSSASNENPQSTCGTQKHQPFKLFTGSSSYSKHVENGLFGARQKRRQKRKVHPARAAQSQSHAIDPSQCFACRRVQRIRWNPPPARRNHEYKEKKRTGAPCMPSPPVFVASESGTTSVSLKVEIRCLLRYSLKSDRRDVRNEAAWLSQPFCEAISRPVANTRTETVPPKESSRNIRSSVHRKYGLEMDAGSFTLGNGKHRPELGRSTQTCVKRKRRHAERASSG